MARFRPWFVALPLLLLAAAACASRPVANAQQQRPAANGNAAPAAPRFRVGIARGLLPRPKPGRLFVIVTPRRDVEPRELIGDVFATDSVVLGRDARFGGTAAAAGGGAAVVDASVATFPAAGALGRLAPGTYRIQALFAFHPDLRAPNAPGNAYSRVVTVTLGGGAASGGAASRPVALELTARVPPESPPADTEHVKFVKLKSERLSRFWGRPIYLRAGVILPKGFGAEPARRYPLRVRVGGFGTRYTAVRGMMAPDSGFYQAWNAEDGPRMVVLHLDGEGPLGDPYQVNSANHGPYGDAVTRELIPFVEAKFRCVGTPAARFTDGGSTGGWVSLALQVFYPDFFNGCWSGYPDGVDFRAFQLVNIYRDANAFVDARGRERPAMRSARDGATRYTMRHEVGMENVIGRGDTYTRSGGQWGAWNAVYGARGRNGLPVPLWDARTGKIDRTAAEHWKRYDLRLVLRQNWPALAPKLRGKLHVWVGEADEYFLNHAVHLLDDFLKRAEPPANARVVFGQGRGHGWTPQTERQIMDEMLARAAGSRGKP